MSDRGKPDKRESDARELEAEAAAIRSKTRAPAAQTLTEIDKLCAAYLEEHGEEREDTTGIRNLRAIVGRELETLRTPPFTAETVPSPAPAMTPPEAFEAIAAARSPIPAGPPTLPPDARRRSPGPPSAPRVLVVEDDPEVIGALVDALEAEGLRVYRAHNGVQALARVLGGTLEEQIPRPHLILLDVMMPKLGGPGVSVALAQTDAWDIPIVYISGHRPPPELDPRFVFLAKPVDLGLLLRTVRDRLRTGEP